MWFFFNNLKTRLQNFSCIRFFRWFKLGAMAWITMAPMSRPRRNLRQLLMYVRVYISTKPWLSQIAKGWLYIGSCLFPKLLREKERMAPAGLSLSPEKDRLRQLSPRARQIYHELKSAIELKDKGRC